MSKVCVAISVRNGERYLGEAIESVLAQEGVDLELRLYDNGSSDGSIELCRRYAATDPRVSVTENGDGPGYFDSMNMALAATSCRYFAPFAADDVMFPGNLAAKVRLLDETGAGFAHSRAARIDENGGSLGPSVSFDGVPEYLPAPQFLLHTAPLNSVSCQSVVVRTSAFRFVGGFDAEEWYCGDWLAWMLLSLRFGVATIREPLMANRLHGESGTSGGHGSGAFAPHEADALERVLADEWFPGRWDGMRAAFRARQRIHLATELERHGHLRAADGHGAYTYALEALRCADAHELATPLLARLLAAAGLREPALPLALVARAPETGVEAGRLVAAAGSLAADGLVASVGIVAEPGSLDAAVAILEPLVADSPLDVQLAEGDLAEALLPGRALVAPAGSPEIALAESLGVPAIPYDVPLPPKPWLAPTLAGAVA
ncbi:MAG TPA: glycosyltransferase [Gaiellaceae bacterium]|nr:glycosyltransferase [Gaiellaceae bacterium]